MEKTVEHLRRYIKIYHKAFVNDIPQLFYTVIKGIAAPMSVDNVALPKCLASPLGSPPPRAAVFRCFFVLFLPKHIGIDPPRRI